MTVTMSRSVKSGTAGDGDGRRPGTGGALFHDPIMTSDRNRREGENDKGHETLSLPSRDNRSVQRSRSGPDPRPIGTSDRSRGALDPSDIHGQERSSPRHTAGEVFEVRPQIR